MRHILTTLFLFIPLFLSAGCESTITVEFKCKKVTVFSSKDVSHVVIHFLNSSKKYDNLNVGSIYVYESDSLIESITVKSGCTRINFENNECNVLPVVMSEYYIEDSTFYWVTEVEINASHFVIEKYPGIRVDSVQAHGNSLVRREYQYDLKESGYYRILQIDFNSDREYFPYVAYFKPNVAYVPVYDIIGRQIK